MDKLRECCVKGCRRIKSVGNLCEKHATEKYLLKLKLSFEEVYGNLDGAKEALQALLPKNIRAKDLASILSFLQVTYSMQDLDNVINIISNTSRKLITLNQLIDKLSNLGKCGHEVMEPLPVYVVDTQKTVSPLVIEINERANLRELISYQLQCRFTSPLEAFDYFSHMQKIGFFQFFRMTGYLGVPCDENQAKEILLGFSSKGLLDYYSFRKIWYNNNSMCLNDACDSLSVSSFGYCDRHFKQVCGKGKILVDQMFHSLDRHTVIHLKQQIVNMQGITKGSVQQLLGNYANCRLNGIDWKNVTMYILSKISIFEYEDEEKFNF